MHVSASGNSFRGVILSRHADSALGISRNQYRLLVRPPSFVAERR